MALAASLDDGVIGPNRSLLANGRHLQPAGTLVGLGNFPTGGALTTDGRYYWTVSTGRGRNDIRIVSVEKKKVVQVIPLPGASGGIAMDPTKPIAYVSGVADSARRPAAAEPARTRGRRRSRLLVPPEDRECGVRAAPVRATAGRDAAGADVPAVDRNPRLAGSPRRLAERRATARAAEPGRPGRDRRDRDRRRALRGDRQLPYGAAITPDGNTGLVANKADGTVSFLDLAAGSKIADVALGHLTHPEAIAVDQAGTRAYVAVANDDRVAVIDLRTHAVVRNLSTARPAGHGTTPTALALTPDG